jgi:phage shock protein A
LISKENTMGLLKSLSRWFRGQKDQAARALADPIRDGKFAIEDSERKVREFQSKVARFMAVNKQVHREIESQRQQVEKWTNIARKAAAAGNEADVVQAVEAKQRAEQVLGEKQKQFDQNEVIVNQLRKQMQMALSKVAKAKANYAQLVARHEGAQVRKELAQAASNFGSGEGPLAELNDLQKAVDTEETEAEAYEELASTSTGPLSLEDKYGGSSSATVDAEVAALMAQAGRGSS